MWSLVSQEILCNFFVSSLLLLLLLVRPADNEPATFSLRQIGSIVYVSILTSVCKHSMKLYVIVAFLNNYA